MKYSITSTIPVTDYKCRDIDQLRNIISGGVKEIDYLSQSTIQEVASLHRCPHTCGSLAVLRRLLTEHGSLGYQYEIMRAKYHRTAAMGEV